MTATVTIDQADLRRITWRLDRLAKTTGRLKPVLEEVGSALETSVSLRFERERGPGGGAWKQSARAKVDGGQTLNDTGRLAQSITSRASDSDVAVGTNVIYAAIHQFGGVIKPVKARALVFAVPGRKGKVRTRKVTMPARPFLGFDAVDRRRVEKIVIDALDRVLAGRPA